MKKEEIAAIILGSLLIFAPLLGGVISNLECSFGQNASRGNYNNHPIDVQGWLTLLVSGLTLFALIFQAWTNDRQRDLMKRQADAMDGQLKATQTAADAALASLDRPWLFIEGLGHNEVDWLECRDILIAKFRIANYGKAPAIIKNLKIAHFRGPDHHNGRPPFELPPDVLDFPRPESLHTFLAANGREPKLLPEPHRVAGTYVRGPLQEISPELVIGGGEKTGTLCSVGYRKLEKLPAPGLHPLGVTESYLIGSIFYEIPGQTAEFLNFCYVKKSGHNFSLFRDWPPYNERQKA